MTSPRSSNAGDSKGAPVSTSSTVPASRFERALFAPGKVLFFLRNVIKAHDEGEGVAKQKPSTISAIRSFIERLDRFPAEFPSESKGSEEYPFEGLARILISIRDYLSMKAGVSAFAELEKYFEPLIDLINDIEEIQKSYHARKKDLLPILTKILKRNVYDIPRYLLEESRTILYEYEPDSVPLKHSIFLFGLSSPTSLLDFKNTSEKSLYLPSRLEEEVFSFLSLKDRSKVSLVSKGVSLFSAKKMIDVIREPHSDPEDYHPFSKELHAVTFLKNGTLATLHQGSSETKWFLKLWGSNGNSLRQSEEFMFEDQPTALKILFEITPQVIGCRVRGSENNNEVIIWNHELNSVQLNTSPEADALSRAQWVQYTPGGDLIVRHRPFRENSWRTQPHERRDVVAIYPKVNISDVIARNIPRNRQMCFEVDHHQGSFTSLPNGFFLYKQGREAGGELVKSSLDDGGEILRSETPGISNDSCTAVYALSNDKVLCGYKDYHRSHNFLGEHIGIMTLKEKKEEGSCFSCFKIRKGCFPPLNSEIGMVLSPDKQYVAFSNSQKTVIYIAETNSLRCTWHYDLPRDKELMAIGWSPEGGLMIVDSLGFSKKSFKKPAEKMGFQAPSP